VAASAEFHREQARTAAAAERRRVTDSVAAIARRRAELRRRGWSAKHVDLVMAQRVAIGMTAAMVRAAWGEPERINSTHTQAGTDEQWVYGDEYVYLRNNIVTAIQTSR
jgi:hypothetical protein